QPAFLTALEKRRNAVEVRGQDDARRLAERGQDVEAAVRDRLLGDLIAARSQEGSQPFSRRGLTARRGIDVNQTAGEKNRIDLRNGLHARLRAPSTCPP